MDILCENCLSSDLIVWDLPRADINKILPVDKFSVVCGGHHRGIQREGLVECVHTRIRNGALRYKQKQVREFMCLF